MKKVITESDIKKMLLANQMELHISEDTIITPLAKDSIKEAGIKIVIGTKFENENNTIIKTNKIAVGCDHTGLEAKLMLSKILKGKGYEIIDVGTHDKNSCDYPDFAFNVASKVALKEVDFGLLIDASGIPSAITANKLPGIRACTCYNEFTAKSAKEHNNGNILVMGAKALGEETMKSILEVWLNTNFAEGRHQKRLNKITEIEKIFINKENL